MERNQIKLTSIKGVTWVERGYDERSVNTMVQKLGIPELLARILSARGVSHKDANSFLNPTIKNLLPDPSSIKDMDVGSERLARAVMNGERVGIFGDYDVDGATSSSVIKCFLGMLGCDAEVYIPDRIAEGYGPNTKAFLELQERGASLIITVDCGTVAFTPIEEATKAGLDVIVVDHHMGEVTIPTALAVINPNRFDDESGLGNLCAAGVAFMMAVATTRALRDFGWFNNRKEPDLLNLLDLVALGTVCDVVPLTGINRAFVAQGLKIMAKRTNIGLAALIDIAEVKEKPSVYHAGFIIGPRINAGGRVGQASLGARILTSNDPLEVSEIVQKLEEHNSERRAIEAIVLEEAIDQVEKAGGAGVVIFAASPNWHPGVVGIAAGRLKDLYHRPVAVMSITDGVAKASCRSISGVNIGTVIAEAKDKGLLLGGGGHAMAAGFTVEERKIRPLYDFFVERLSGIVAKNSDRISEFDGFISLGGVNSDLIKKLEMAGPFGTGNPEPKFVFPNVKVTFAEAANGGHIRCFLGEPDKDGGRHRIKAMAFRAMENEIGQKLLSSIGKTLHVAGTIRINSWGGHETPEISILDLIG